MLRLEFIGVFGRDERAFGFHVNGFWGSGKGWGIEREDLINLLGYWL